MLKYLKNSFARKKARRVTRDYPTKIFTYDIEGEGKVEFAQWENPLFKPEDLTPDIVNFYKKCIKKGPKTGYHAVVVCNACFRLCFYI